MSFFKRPLVIHSGDQISAALQSTIKALATSRHEIELIDIQEDDPLERTWPLRGGSKPVKVVHW